MKKIPLWIGAFLIASTVWAAPGGAPSTAAPAAATPAKDVIPLCTPGNLPIVASCSFPFDMIPAKDGTQDANFFRIVSCMDVYSKVVTPDMLKAGCKGNATPSALPCPKGAVLFDCVQDRGVAVSVLHYYEVPNGSEDPAARAYNRKKLKKGCEAPNWRSCHW